MSKSTNKKKSHFRLKLVLKNIVLFILVLVAINFLRLIYLNYRINSSLKKEIYTISYYLNEISKSKYVKTAEFALSFNNDYSKMDQLYKFFKNKNPAVKQLFQVNTRGKIIYPINNIQNRAIIREYINFIMKNKQSIIPGRNNLYFFNTKNVINMFDNDVGYLISMTDIKSYLTEKFQKKNLYFAIANKKDKYKIYEKKENMTAIAVFNHKLEIDTKERRFLFIRKSNFFNSSFDVVLTREIPFFPNSLITFSIFILLYIFNALYISKIRKIFSKIHADRLKNVVKGTFTRNHVPVVENLVTTLAEIKESIVAFNSHFSQTAAGLHHIKNDLQSGLSNVATTSRSIDVHAYSSDTAPAVSDKNNKSTAKSGKVKMEEGKKTAIISDPNVEKAIVYNLAFGDDKFMEFNLEEFERMNEEQTKDDSKNKKFTAGKTNLMSGGKKEIILKYKRAKYLDIQKLK